MRTRSTSPVPETLKRLNMRRFVDLLLAHGELSRADLTRMTGVSSATSSNIIGQLLEIGVIEELASPAVTSGRPAKVFQLARTNRVCAGVSLGVEECSICIAGLNGVPLESGVGTLSTPKSYSSLISGIGAKVKELTSGLSATSIGLGVSAPGLMDEHEGRSLYCPTMPQIETQRLAEDLGVAMQMEVTCVQENHGLCLAEQRFGNAKDVADFVVVDVSAGIGAGVMSRGRRVPGVSGQTGELGHITVQPDGAPCACGNRGCLESCASESVFVQRVSQRLGGDLTLADVIRLVNEGVIRVDQELDPVFGFLAIGIGAMINLLNPGAVFMHGRIFDVSPRALDSLKEKVSERTLKPHFSQCQIRRSQVTKVDGALAAVLERYWNSIGPRLD